MIPVGRARPAPTCSRPARRCAASTASASALASKASTVRAGPAQLRGTAMLWRRPVATVRWPGGRRVLVLRADLEQRRIGEAARLVARRRVDQVGQDRRPHGVERGVDRVQRGAGRRWPPPKRSACLRGRNDQVTASFRPRAASARRACGTRRCIGVAHRPGRRRERAAARWSGSCRSRTRGSLPPPDRPRPRCRGARTARRPSTGPSPLDAEAELAQDVGGLRWPARRSPVSVFTRSARRS